MSLSTTHFLLDSSHLSVYVWLTLICLCMAHTYPFMYGHTISGVMCQDVSHLVVTCLYGRLHVVIYSLKWKD